MQVRINYHKDFHYLHVLNNYLFNYLNLVGLTASPAAKCHMNLVATITILGLYRIAARPASLDAIPIAQCYWIF